MHIVCLIKGFDKTNYIIQKMNHNIIKYRIIIGEFHNKYCLLFTTTAVMVGIWDAVILSIFIIVVQPTHAQPRGMLQVCILIPLSWVCHIMFFF